MERWSLAVPPTWWSPKLSPFWVRLCRPWRLWQRRWQQRLLDIQVHGAGHLRQALAADQGVLITPNHAGHADCYVLYHTADAVACPFYFMVAWQVLAKHSRFVQRLLRYHGCFSVDRERNDLRAFRQAVEILRTTSAPLVVFPEGEVYHTNDRVTPFREGPAAMALAAARRAERPVVCLPAAIKYQYLEDPTPHLHRLLDRLEQRVLWCPRPELSLAARVRRFTECLLTLRELEYLGEAQPGNPAERSAALSNVLLGRIELRCGVPLPGTVVPERVKAVRQCLLKELAEFSPTDPRRAQADRDLEDLFVVVQLFSYPADYLADQPSLERLAETVDKFEEDVFGVPTATVRAARRAVIAFGEPLVVTRPQKKKDDVQVLTALLEQRVQALLDEISFTADRPRAPAHPPPVETPVAR